MAIQFITSRYDEMSNKTKIYLEDVTPDTQTSIQELALGDVTSKSEQEQLELALELHYARYYSNKATNELVDTIAEKSKILNDLIGKAGELTKQHETAMGSMSELMTVLFNSECLIITDTGKVALNNAILRLIGEQDD
ncbi:MULTISPECIES: hypothetical protein [unclassified Granulicatella]|uniref:hypothetical protein n=1 Tax=unclassified Granulicatella TaxID=2630493 RepID=UPI00107331A8|nr:MULTISPECIES: hypothetical protein [unclassified Granulicatella]MBF0780520.1 hypothetical protein [Granulicatella sp. 19428wC4_WM01]TFU95334.1 hypothetical protein E4T68_05370 [Granulicatella sp. WM01]